MPVPPLKDIAKDVMVAVLGTAVGLAGLLLVFIGFVYAHAEGMSNTRRARLYKVVAKIGLVPFLTSLVSAWLSFSWLGGSADAYAGAILFFYLTIVFTGLYGAIALLLLL